MKTTKLIFSLLFSLLAIVFVAAVLHFQAGINFYLTLLVLFCLALIPQPKGVLKTVLVEIWTGELVKKFREMVTFLKGIPSHDDKVNNNTIHLVDIGADPTVLINNSTYPIAVAARTDADIPIGLDKFDTTNTKVTDDELHAISYDKIGSVVEEHKNVLVEKTASKALHALAPASDAAGTPVIETTGPDDGTGRKRMTIADVIALKKKFDDMKIPSSQRRLVLCNEHVQDLLLADQTFRDQYSNIAEGKVLPLYGFEIHQWTDCPVYDEAGAKKAFGAAAAAGDRNASVAFYLPRAFKAEGTKDMYFKDAKENPEYRESVVGFRMYFICMPKKAEGFGAIISAPTA